jgi:hypothetical protein
MPYQVDHALRHAMSGTELSRVRTELRLLPPEPNNQRLLTSRGADIVMQSSAFWLHLAPIDSCCGRQRHQNARLLIWGCNSIPIARSINPDDSVDLIRLSQLKPTKKRLVLDGSWTVLRSIGRWLLSQSSSAAGTALLEHFDNKYG